VTTAAKSHLNTREFQELEELVAEYANIFARDNEDYGRTNKVYHRIDKGDARPIRQPPRRVPLANQAEVKEMLDNVRRRRIGKPLVVPGRFSQEKEWGTPLLRG
jgi:hypothetical protein